MYQFLDKFNNKTLIINLIWEYKQNNYNLDVLKEDCAYEGFSINSYEDFVKLLNSFRRFNYIKTIDERITLIKLRRVD